MVINMYKSRKLIECTTIEAQIIKNGSQVIYTGVYAVLTDGSTLQLVPERKVESVEVGGWCQGIIDKTPEDERISASEVWEKVKKAIMAGKAVSLPL